MNRIVYVYVYVLAAIASMPLIVSAKNCKKGQPCGNSCISWKKTCRIGSTSAYLDSDKAFSSLAQQQVTNYIVSADFIDLKAFPNDSYEVIAILPKGTKVTSSTPYNEWLKITVDGKTGWVESFGLERDEEREVRTLEPTALQQEQPEEVHVVASYRVVIDVVQVKTMPNQSYGTLTVLREGAVIQALTPHNKWVKVSVNGKIGWIESFGLKRL
ncbi:SH3 domain-containing protein [Shewanella algae]|uniref:SH3 domain-containing protein n=1 Tax=Shewanella algae TaxID=38313 RepID=UPI001AAFB25B|nr:SH3 domain-containing protein [Shewanella algae]MBO2548356.1 SH3 domain-containing protein [Shewanella algae]